MPGAWLGGTPLHLAASQASEVVVSQILRAGAAPEPVDEAEGRTPLHYAAAYRDDPAVILALLNAGSNPALRDDFGQRPVDLARTNDAIIGTEACPRLVVNDPELLTAGRAFAGRIESTDGCGGVTAAQGETGRYEIRLEVGGVARSGRAIERLDRR